LRVLAVDIGTNSTLHLLADVVDEELLVIENDIIGNGLGAKMGADGRIGDGLMKLNRQILSDLTRLAQENDCEVVGAVGTQALRKATNNDQFISMAQEVSLPVSIISNREEALLAWRGVFGDDEGDHQRALLDIGGGSSELSVGRGEMPEWTDSVEIGAVTLSRNCFHDDPPKPDQINAARTAIRFAFSNWDGIRFDKLELTGIAGTIFMLAALENEITEYSSGCVEGLILNAEAVSSWCDRLLSCELSERRELCRISPQRAESIHTGSLILVELMSRFGWKQIKVSERGLLHGLALQLACR